MSFESSIRKTFTGAALCTMLAIGANAVLPYTLEASVSPKNSVSRISLSDRYLGIVVVSNNNEIYSRLDAMVLKDKFYDNVSIQKTTKDDKDFYRVVVGPQENAGLETILARLKEEKPLGTDDFFMLVNEERWEENRTTVEKKPEPTKEKYAAREAKKIIPASKKPATPEKAKKKIAWSAPVKAEPLISLDSLSKDEYISFISQYIEKNHRMSKGKSLEPGKSTMIASNIYDSAKEARIPVLEWTAHIATESNFTNMLGDLNFKKNYSEGYIQMRKTTQKFVFDKMKKAGWKSMPAKLPDSILNYESLQFRMGAFYYRRCIDAAHGDRRLASSKYNAGEGNDHIQRKYVNKIDRYKSDIYRHTKMPQAPIKAAPFFGSYARQYRK